MPLTRKIARSRKAAVASKSRGASSRTTKSKNLAAKSESGKSTKSKSAATARGRTAAAKTVRRKVSGTKASATKASAAKSRTRAPEKAGTTVKKENKSAARTARASTARVASTRVTSKSGAKKTTGAKSRAAKTVATAQRTVKKRTSVAKPTAPKNKTAAPKTTRGATPGATAVKVVVEAGREAATMRGKAQVATVIKPAVSPLERRESDAPAVAAPVTHSASELIKVRQNMTQPTQKPVAIKPVASLAANAVGVAKAIPVKPASAPQKVVPASKARPLSHKLGFKLSEFIVYPAHGVGQIIGIEVQEVAGFSLELFVVSFIKDKMILKVPTSKAPAVGMRKLSETDVVEKALATLSGRARVKRTMWSRRAQEYEAKINSGDLVTIAEVVRDLYRSDTQPEQSYSERQLYEAALDRMAREVAAVRRLIDQEALRLIESFLAKAPRRGGKGDAIEAEAGAEEADVERAA